MCKGGHVGVEVDAGKKRARVDAVVAAMVVAARREERRLEVDDEHGRGGAGGVRVKGKHGRRQREAGWGV